MPLATCIQDLRVDSTTIVTHHNSKVPACILYFYFYSIRLSMPKCVYESLAADTIHLVSNSWSQGAPVAVGDDPVADFFVDGEFLAHARECQLEVAAIGIR